MEIIILVSITIGLLLIGFINLFLNLRSIRRTKKFLIDYNNTFVEYLNTHGSDQQKYQYLVMNSNKAQNLLGHQGLINFRPPFANYAISNYAIVLNGISEVNRNFSTPYLENQAIQMGQILTDSLIRKFGDISQEEEYYSKEIVNPIKLLVSGVGTILSIPILFLSSLNIISSSITRTIIKSSFFKIVSGLITFIGLISSIFSLVFSWDQIIDFITNIFS